MAIDEEITLKKLQVFLQFMHSGSLARTAEALGQSGVSVHRALHSLESGLRCPLFQKQGRALLPLPTAHTFAAYAAEAVRSCELGIEKTQEVAGFRATRITIGCAYSLTVRTVPQLLYGLKTRRPQLDVDLNLGSSQESITRLRAGEVDAAIVVLADDAPEPPDTVGLTLFEDEIAFAAPLGSRYAGRSPLDLAEAREETFVALRQDYIAPDRVQGEQTLFARAGFVPTIGMHAGNLFALASMVGDGIGYALLPRRVGLFTSQVELLPLAPAYAARQRIAALVLAARERDPNLLALMAECRRAYR